MQRVSRPLLSVVLAAGIAAAAPAAPLSGAAAAAQDIPLPEHPRPDFQRPSWQNLNGAWSFQFDPQGSGEAQGWATGGLPEAREITVPFGWGSALSGVPDSADIGWYERMVTVPQEWDGQRVFLVIGAADWHTTAWIDGQPLGTHQGGYIPFEFELTPHVRRGQQHRIVLRIDDAAREFKLEGKQGYGNVRGIWQTPYLEARGTNALGTLHFSPDIDAGTVRVDASLLEPAREALTLRLTFDDPSVPAATQQIPAGNQRVSFTAPVPDARLWSLDDPHLYEVTAQVEGGSGAADELRSYFGMRKISVVDLPGTDYPYVAINGQPVYLQLALDQAYHPDGYYTFPSDEFTRDEVLRAREIGLNGLRVHIKVPLPRKLYWADRLGMLIMEDLPNSWGAPDAEARQESESTLRAMIHRDYNHPSVFSWIVFNETWGLRHREGDREVYRPETKQWVVSMVELAKSLDSTRLVEDNSVCCGVGHTVTDLNSWHSYLPGWEWEEHLRVISDSTYPGSPWNFEEGWEQARQPNINSEFGNVWGYEGSAGDVDYTWDYHRSIEAFRRYPKVAGWLYTEHHDVINEWNGYWRFDRSNKVTGLDDLVPGMSLRDLHAPIYVAMGDQLSRDVTSGEEVEVPLRASFLTGNDAYGDRLILRTELYWWDHLGARRSAGEETRAIPYRPWMVDDLEPLRVRMPAGPAVAVVALRVEDEGGVVLGRNFTTFVVGGEAPQTAEGAAGERLRLLRIDPTSFAAAEWSRKQWNVMDGLKVNGAGSGFFEYRVPWPAGVSAEALEGASLVAELGAKELFGKDQEGAAAIQGDFMRGEGTLDPSRNPNAYPMTDEVPFPGAVTLRVNGVLAGRQPLADDPADHRGILSWHSQLRDRRLREAGSYGELVTIAIPREALRRAQEAGELVLRLEVDAALPAGLAIYGERFGRYPLDPTIVLVER